MSPGNRAIEMMLDAVNGQELTHCWCEAVGRRDGLLLFEQKMGRLPTEDEVRACGLAYDFIEGALDDLHTLIAWRRWNKEHEEVSALGPRVGYRDDARGIARRRPFPPPVDAPWRRPGVLLRLLSLPLRLPWIFADALIAAWCWLDNLGRKVPLWKRSRRRHRVADPVLEQRVHEDAGADVLGRVPDDAETEAPVSRERLK